LSCSGAALSASANTSARIASSFLLPPTNYYRGSMSSRARFG
jgi:hypothetical protein